MRGGDCRKQVTEVMTALVGPATYLFPDRKLSVGSGTACSITLSIKSFNLMAGTISANAISQYPIKAIMYSVIEN